MIVQLFRIKKKIYRTCFWYMNRVEAINIINNSDLKEKKVDPLKNITSIFCVCVYI